MRIAGAVLLVVAACEHNDIGNACPQLELPDVATSGDGRAQTEEIVEQNVAFPCDELICIATNGLAGYCSRKCRDDSGCPSGFECREVQPLGVFAGEKFCAWKRCSKAKDCGNVDDFCCDPVPNSGPLEDVKLCSFKDGDSC